MSAVMRATLGHHHHWYRGLEGVLAGRTRLQYPGFGSLKSRVATAGAASGPPLVIQEISEYCPGRTLPSGLEYTSEIIAYLQYYSRE